MSTDKKPVEFDLDISKAADHPDWREPTDEQLKPLREMSEQKLEVTYTTRPLGNKPVESYTKADPSALDQMKRTFANQVALELVSRGLIEVAERPDVEKQEIRVTLRATIKEPVKISS